MAFTLTSNFSFVPQIAQDHIAGYFRSKLIIAKLASKPPDNQFPNTPGNTLTFPYFGKIGEAEEPAEGADVDIDSLGDDDFTTTIKEIAKGVGITDSALKKKGCTHEQWEREAHDQIARVLAEKVEKDCWAELVKSTSHDALPSPSMDVTLTSAFGTGTAKGKDSTELAAQLCTIDVISESLTDAFGDRRDECQAIVLHSQHYKDIETAEKSGFLKADANDPLYKAMDGFQGRIPRFFGLPLFINDGVPKGADITLTDSGGSTQKYATYNVVFLKKDAFGLFIKQAPKVEYGRNIRARQDFMVATQWYGVKGFHKIIDTEDRRVAFKRLSTKQQVA